MVTDQHFPPTADASGFPERWAVPSVADEVVASEPPPPAPEAPPFQVAAPRPVGDPTPRVGLPAPSASSFVWVGAHGGSGITSLSLSTEVLELRELWPDPQLGWPSTVAVVCRSNMAGLTAATRLLQEAAAGMVPDLRVAALVVVDDDSARMSKRIRTRIRELGGTVPSIYRVPWIPAWRDNPYHPQRAPQKVASRIEALIQKENQS